MVKKLKWNLVFMSVLYLGLGIFLVMKPGTALNIVCYALGGVVLACAAVQLIRYFVVERGVFQSQLTLISGLVCLALGAFLLLRSDIVVSILPIVFGLFVIFDAIGRVQNALDLRRCGYDSWKGFLLLPVLSVVLGVILIANPFGAMETLVMAIGVILIVEGAINLLSALYTVLAVRRFAKLHPETQSVLESITGEDLNGDGVVAPDVTRTDAEATAVELDHVDESATVEQEKQEYVGIIENNNALLLQLIGDILDLSKIQSGTREPEKKRVDLSSLAGTVLERFQILTEQSGYKFDLSADADCFVTADERMVEQIVYNLIGNAVSYTGEDKKVGVRVKRLENAVRVEISDSGKGIAPSERDKVWDRYYRSSQAKRAIVGSGIGLSICKNLLVLHGAEYGIDSVVNNGSTFWFVMPYAPETDEKSR